MKPGEGRQQKDNAGELSSRGTEPIHRHFVDNDCRAAAGENAQHNQRQIGILKQQLQQPAETDIQEISRWMRLMDSRVKMPHSQSKINGIQVVKVMTAKHKTSDGDHARQKE